MQSVRDISSASYYTLHNMIVKEFEQLGYSVSDMADKSRLINLAKELGMESLHKKLEHQHVISNRSL